MQPRRLFIVAVGILDVVGTEAVTEAIRQQKIIQMEGPRNQRSLRADSGEGKQCAFVLSGNTWRFPVARQILLAQKEGADSAGGFEHTITSSKEDEGTALQDLVFVLAPVDIGPRRCDG